MVGNPTDGGPGPSDAGPSMDGGTPRDSGPVSLDAGRDGGTRPDAGPPDSGPPPCGCPAYPTECRAPEANEPTFTPDARAMGAQLFDLIACAQSTLQIAMYEAEWPCIADALSTALERDADLTIDVVVDNERCGVGSCLFDELEATGRVRLVRDTRSAFMHHKYVIADGARVWISSGNFSERSFCIDHNNAIIVDEPLIVDRYETIFVDMMNGRFSPVDQPVETASSYTVWTSPHSPTTGPAQWETAILEAIRRSPRPARIEVLMSAFTTIEFANALIEAHENGVEVRLLVSNLYASWPPAQAMLAAGIPSRRGSIHDKVVIIDDQVFTGSANWSANARSSNENVIRIENADVAAAYRAEFDAVFATARAVTPEP